ATPESRPSQGGMSIAVILGPTRQARRSKPANFWARGRAIWATPIPGLAWPAARPDGGAWGWGFDVRHRATMETMETVVRPRLARTGRARGRVQKAGDVRHGRRV